MSQPSPSLPPSPGPAGDAAPGSAGLAGARPAAAPCQLVLVKKGQRYVFRYLPGDEAKALESIADLARDPGSDLDWFDAAVLSHQMSKNLSQQINRAMKAN